MLRLLNSALCSTVALSRMSCTFAYRHHLFFFPGFFLPNQSTFELQMYLLLQVSAYIKLVYFQNAISKQSPGHIECPTSDGVHAIRSSKGTEINHCVKQDCRSRVIALNKLYTLYHRPTPCWNLGEFPFPQECCFEIIELLVVCNCRSL